MSIKQLGGVFGRNPTFNDVTIEGQLTFDGDIDINSDLKIDGDLEVSGTSTLAGLSATTGGFSGNVIVGDYTSTDIRLSEIRTNKAIFSIFTDGATNGNGTTIGYSWANGGQGPLKFNNAAGEVARFTTNGNLAFVSGKGIDFSATAGTGTSELLDDYEEGTWTANLTMTSGSVGYGSQLGKYVKVGNQVTANAWIYINSVSSPSGALSVALPFPIPSTVTRPGSYIMNGNLTGVTGQTAGWVNTNTANLLLVQSNNGVMSNLDGTNLQVGSELYISITYIV